MKKARSPARPRSISASSPRPTAGTLFLDEIGELPLDAQVKLLRALQEGEIDPVGARRSVRVDFRLVSATNQNLIELVKRGRFREDLFYRLNVFPITIPPLRARACDVPDLALRFLARFCAEEGKRIRGISNEALALLCAYDWPGNVRQLENAMFRAVVLADGDELTTAEFPQIAAQVEGFEVRIPPAPPPVAADPAALCPPSPRRTIEPRDPHALRLIDDNGDVRKLEEIEAEIDSLRARPLSRPNVADRPQARHRPFDALPKDEGERHRRRHYRRRRGMRGGRASGRRQGRHFSRAGMTLSYKTESVTPSRLAERNVRSDSRKLHRLVLAKGIALAALVLGANALAAADAANEPAEHAPQLPACARNAAKPRRRRRQPASGHVQRAAWSGRRDVRAPRPVSSGPDRRRGAPELRRRRELDAVRRSDCAFARRRTSEPPAGPGAFGKRAARPGSDGDRCVARAPHRARRPQSARRRRLARAPGRRLGRSTPTAYSRRFGLMRPA